MADLTDADIRRLIEAATVARRAAYVPYSHFAVGAALCGPDGQVFSGCNVENASYGLTICAERNAVFQAVARGMRDLRVIAVVTENGVTPCGGCRQVLNEFNPEMTVIVADVRGRRQVYRLDQLLPDAFGPDQLLTR